jgi:hypothetical protein
MLVQLASWSHVRSVAVVAVVLWDGALITLLPLSQKTRLQKLRMLLRTARLPKYS